MTEAVNDPARGPRYVLWLLDELRGTFEAYREGYLEAGRLVTEEGVKEKDLHEFLARFDPTAEDFFLQITLQLKGKMKQGVEEFLERLKIHHRGVLEAKLRELGAWMFGKVLERLAELRAEVEQVDHRLGLIQGELHALEKDVVAEILSLNYANTHYLFDAGDVGVFYAERFVEADSERQTLRQLTGEVLAPYHGDLMKLGAMSYESDRRALLQTIVRAAGAKFNEGPQPFKLDQTSVVERFFAKHPDRKKQEAILHHLYNHSTPFIHIDGKQAAHKFTLTGVQKVAGLAGADTAQPPREVQEMLKVLNAACQIGPAQIKHNPDRHTLVFLQEFGAYPLRVIKGLEGYKAYYEHFKDHHLHITKAHGAFADLFPPDEAKLADAQRALTLGLALGLLQIDPTNGRTVVYHYRDAAGLADTLALGAEEQAGISTLVGHDEARAKLLASIEQLGRGAGMSEKRAIYDNLVRYARAMEAKLGTRHARYQAQKRLLGDFIKTHLLGEGGEAPQAEASVPAAPPQAAGSEAMARYEALFAHFWVDRVIDAAERSALDHSAATLGLSPDQASAIEAKLQQGQGRVSPGT
ncbi:MAG: hypothetical protein ACLGIN_14240 [Candidatus Sericytochromatia bacterium]